MAPRRPVAGRPASQCLPLPASKDTSVWLDFSNKEFAKAWTGQESVADAAKAVVDEVNTALANEQ